MTSKAGYWIGAGLIVAAVGGAILWAVLAFGHLVSSVDDFQRVAVPGRETVTLEAHKYVIYVEGPNADESIPAMTVAVADANTEKPVPVESYGGSLTYSFDTTGSARATVTPPHAGAYVVQSSGISEGSGYSLALGESIGGKLVAAIVGAFAIGGVLGIAGVALLIVTGVRRSRRRKSTAQSGDAWPPQSPA